MSSAYLISKHIVARLNENANHAGISLANNKYLFSTEDGCCSIKLAEIFHIPDTQRFCRAFSAVTNGVGNEIRKINNIKSSSLLSLLVFHQLFDNDSDDTFLKLTLNGHEYEFRRCFFEVKNRVIRFPSSVDIVLVATDGTLLFLEAKFLEPLDHARKSKQYGKSYLELYKSLEPYFSKSGLSIKYDNERPSIEFDNGNCGYIEGIKQAISHLIGITRGYKDGHTSNQVEYIKAYNDSSLLIFGTLLFDTEAIINSRDDASVCRDYSNLYTNTFGKFGNQLLSIINDKFQSSESKIIKVLNTPLTYQEVLHKNPQYDLPAPIKILYKFDSLTN